MDLIICLRELDTLAPAIIHQTRVAIRTIQSYLETFDDVLTHKYVREFHDWLRELHKSLTQIRNLDVFSELISTNKVTLVNREFVIEEITRQRAFEVSIIKPKLTPELVMGYVHAIEIFQSSLPIRNQVSSMKTRAQNRLLVSELDKHWKIFQSNYKKSRIRPSPRRRHKLRISAKNVRYVYELSRRMQMPEHPKRLARVIELQDTLGVKNDVYTFYKWLRTIAPD